MASILRDRRVALIREEPSYSNEPPFDPSEAYPEFPKLRVSSVDNPAFRAVRLAFKSMQYDIDNYGSENWNPLSGLVRAGQKVVLKPNLVLHRNAGERDFGLTDTECLVTHGSVIRAVLDYVAVALCGDGTIIIGDCPLQGTDWDRVLAITGIPAIIERARKSYPGIEIKVRDYRLAVAETRGGVASKRIVRDVSLDDYVEIDLGKRSLLIPLMSPGCEFGVSQYPRTRMRAAHDFQTNKYLLARDFLTADVLINLPKVKCHQKAGITVALKNFVGLNGHKDYLPHFRFGSPSDGGDEYPEGNLLWRAMWASFHRDWEYDSGWRKAFWRKLGSAFEILHSKLPGKRHSAWLGGGGWSGNDTLWRTVLDINRAFFYFDANTEMVSESPRNDMQYLAIADGLIGGEGEGPLAPSPIPSGFVLCSSNSLALDGVSGLYGPRFPETARTSRGIFAQRYAFAERHGGGD